MGEAFRGAGGGGRLRVLWLTNVPLPAARQRDGLPPVLGGGWLSSALDLLVSHSDIELVCAARSWPPHEPFEAEGVRYVTLHRDPPAGGVRGVLRAWRRVDDVLAAIDEAKHLVEEVRPDVVHVHGTEMPSALAMLRASQGTPTLVSLQGFPSECLRYAFAGMSARDRSADVLNLEFVKGRGITHDRRRMQQAARLELKTLALARDVAGRTAWDQDVVRRVNPTARYWHLDETLRRPFYDSAWSGPQDGTPCVFATASAAPFKGLDVLLRAFAAVRSRRPCKLAIAGQVVESPLWRVVLRPLEADLGLRGHVEWLGGQPAEAVADLMSSCSVFVCASRIENSPNSVCEAMMVGAPVVATSTGGIPSLIEDGKEGLLFPNGDHEALARAIERVLDDSDLARRLGEAASCTAVARHEPARATQQLIEVYQEIAKRDGQALMGTEVRS